MVEPRRILMGVVGRPHGVRGLVHVQSYAEADLAAYRPLLDEHGRAWTLRWHAEGVAELRDAEGRPVPDRSAAERLVNAKLYVDRAQLPPAQGEEFYLCDLVGLRAVSVDGAALGRVVQVHDYGAGASLELEGGLLVPFTRAAVPAVDIAGGTLVIDPPGDGAMPPGAAPGVGAGLGVGLGAKPEGAPP